MEELKTFLGENKIFFEVVTPIAATAIALIQIWINFRQGKINQMLTELTIRKVLSLQPLPPDKIKCLNIGNIDLFMQRVVFDNTNTNVAHDMPVAIAAGSDVFILLSEIQALNPGWHKIELLLSDRDKAEYTLKGEFEVTDEHSVGNTRSFGMMKNNPIKRNVFSNFITKYLIGTQAE